jgi:hypothetical protein
MRKWSRFHPSLGIPLIITPHQRTLLVPHQRSFHPSLGIPLIITGMVAKRAGFPRLRFPSLFRDSSDHHLAEDRAGGRGFESVSIPL